MPLYNFVQISAIYFKFVNSYYQLALWKQASVKFGWEFIKIPLRAYVWDCCEMSYVRHDSTFTSGIDWTHAPTVDGTSVFGM